MPQILKTSLSVTKRGLIIAMCYPKKVILAETGYWLYFIDIFENSATTIWIVTFYQIEISF